MNAERLGRCYQLAGRYAMDNPDTVLVHGSIQGMGKPRLDHAWVEVDAETTYEPITDQLWPRVAFDAFFNTRYAVRYSPDEWRVHAAETRHWGPW